MKTLKVRWQRLVNDTGQTCERCGSTGEAVQNAFNKLKKALAELGIEVVLETAVLDFAIFSKDPLQSNRIWIGEKPLEDWLGASAGQSQCCDACGDNDCRTLAFGQHSFDAIPERLIVKAGLLAAAELLSA